jgi:hypothetical protein
MKSMKQHLEMIEGTEAFARFDSLVSSLLKAPHSGIARLYTAKRNEKIQGRGPAGKAVVPGLLQRPGKVPRFAADDDFINFHFAGKLAVRLAQHPEPNHVYF